VYPGSHVEGEMISEEHLIGWLCMTRFNWASGHTIDAPAEVDAEMVRLGWMTIEPEADWDGNHFANLTDKGRAVCDLYAAEWGIESLEMAEDE